MVTWQSAPGRIRMRNSPKGTSMARSKQRSLRAALALATLLAIGGLAGCGGGGASVAKADAVVVTYYYLPL